MTNSETLSELAHEACMLASLIEGLDVLNDATGPSYSSEHITERRASNAMRPVIEAAIKAAWALTERIEEAERATEATAEASVSIPIVHNAAELEALIASRTADRARDVTPD